MYVGTDVDHGPEFPDLVICRECDGGERVELIDAPDYQGPAVCQACDGNGCHTP